MPHVVVLFKSKFCRAWTETRSRIFVLHIVWPMIAYTGRRAVGIGSELDIDGFGFFRGV